MPMYDIGSISAADAVQDRSGFGFCCVQDAEDQYFGPRKRVYLTAHHDRARTIRERIAGDGESGGLFMHGIDRGAVGDEEQVAIDQEDGFVDQGETANAIVRALDTVRAEVAGFHARAAAYEENARALHSRIETLQHDQVRALLKPFFERLAALHAQAKDSAERFADDSESAEDFRFFSGAIEDMFSLYDIDSVEATAGGPFDPKTQQPSRVIPTDDPARDGTVHRVVRQGFIFAGAERVFLPARVSVYRHTPTPGTSDD